MQLSLFFGALFSAAATGFLVSAAGSIYLFRRYWRWRGNERVFLRAMAIMSTGATVLLAIRFGQFLLIVVSGTLPVPPFDPAFYLTVAFYLAGIILLCIPAVVGYDTVRRLNSPEPPKAS